MRDKPLLYMSYIFSVRHQRAIYAIDRLSVTRVDHSTRKLCYRKNDRAMRAM